MTMNRRQLMAAAAAGFGAQLGPAAPDAIAQTATPASPAATPRLPPDSGLFKGFEARWVRTNGADIFLRHGGKGPPLLLLHGNPQSLTCWHRVAGSLASRFHVVAADLRAMATVWARPTAVRNTQLLVSHDGPRSVGGDGASRP